MKNNPHASIGPLESQHGRLAELMRIVLDESYIGGSSPYDLVKSMRSTWAEILGVSRAAISQWVTGKTIPSPEHFRIVIDVLEGLDDSPDQANRRVLEYFYNTVDEKMDLLTYTSQFGECNRKARRVIPGRLSDYILAPSRDALSNRLSSALSRMACTDQMRCLSEVSELLDALENDSAATAARTKLSNHIAQHLNRRSSNSRRSQRSNGGIGSSFGQAGSGHRKSVA